jgi:hypothetical protein
MLNLSRNSLTDAVCEPLTDLRALVWLSLDNTLVGDDGVAHLVMLPNLQALCLSVTRISNEAISILKNAKRLTYLVVSNTMLSDACVDELKSLPGLTYLNIKFTRITPSVLDQLTDELPHVRIESRPKPLPQGFRLGLDELE